MEKSIIVVNCLGTVLSEHRTMAGAWQSEPSSACHVINFSTGEVHSPVIIENTWDGDFELASPGETGRLLGLHRAHNPTKFDYQKIRRRIEDALRKTNDQAILIEMARRLKVKIV